MNKEAIDMEDTEKFLDLTDPTLTKIISKNEKVTFNGLSKEEIMRYGNDPFWVKIRWMLFIIFWAIWIGMLSFAILIVVYSPKCAYRPKLKWWQNEIIYQVDVENFSDSDSNNLGDLNGLIQRIDYLDNLNIKCLALRDNILQNNLLDIKKNYGSLETLSKLKRELEKREIYLVLDLPAEKLKQNDTDILNFWLRNYVDGVRVDSLVSSSKLDEWLKLADQIHSDTFKYKLIATRSNKTEPEDQETYLNLATDFSNTATADLKDVNSFIAKLNSSAKSNGYLVNSYNSKRIADSIEPNLLKIYHSLVLLLKGSPLILYGDEIALNQKNSRMKWEPSENCGFSQSKTLQKSADCKNNVKSLLAYGSGKTLLKTYNKIIELREEPSFKWGKVITSENLGKSSVISYLRQADGFVGYLVAANVGKNQSELVDLVQRHQLASDTAKVVFFDSIDLTNHDDFKINNTISASHIILHPYQLLILKI